MSAVDVLAVMDVAALSQAISEDRKDMADARAAVAELMEASAVALICMDASHDWQAIADDLRAALAACRGDA